MRKHPGRHFLRIYEANSGQRPGRKGENNYMVMAKSTHAHGTWVTGRGGRDWNLNEYAASPKKICQALRGLAAMYLKIVPISDPTSIFLPQPWKRS
jgi:hypothetical protein